MISLTPNSTPQDTNGAFAVLAVISDPAAAKKRLAELIDASKEFEAALKAAQEAEAKAREAASTLDKREAEITRREQEVAARELAISEREKQWAETRAHIVGKVAEVAEVAA
jgi:uncharacterized protein (DUF3084 family)